MPSAAASSIADPLQGAAARVHRRLAKLLGVHLAEALEALQLDALARQLEHRAAQLARRSRPPASFSSERDHERGLADLGDQLRVRVDQLLVGGRVEQLLRQLVLAGEAAAAVGALDDEALLVRA